MGSTVFVFIAVASLITLGAIFFIGYGFELLFNTIENSNWKWKDFWLSLSGLVFMFLGILAVPDMIKYQDYVKKIETKAEVYESQKVETSYDYVLTFEDNSTVSIHNAKCIRKYSDGLLCFSLPNGEKYYYKNYKAIKETPLATYSEIIESK